MRPTLLVCRFGIQYYLRAACLKEDTKEVVRSLNVPFTVIQPYTPVPSAGNDASVGLLACAAYGLLSSSSLTEARLASGVGVFRALVPSTNNNGP